MIGDSRPTKARHVDIVEVEDDEADLIPHKRSRTPFHGSVSSPSIVESIAPSEPFSPRSEGSPDKNRSPPVRPAEVFSGSNVSNAPPPRPSISRSNSSRPSPPANGNAPPFALPNGQNHNDTMWQAALQHMMQSPGQFQRIVHAFANQQQPYPGLSPGSNAVLSPYDPAQAEYNRWQNQPVASSSTAPNGQSLLAHAEDPSMQLLMDESARLHKSYRDAHEIDADMDMLQTSIDSLIQNLGIDPGTLAQPHDELGSPCVNGATPTIGDYPTPLTPDTYANGMHGLNGMGGLGTENAQPDYLLDSLLSRIGDGQGGPGAGYGVGGGGPMDYNDVTDNYDHSARIDGTSIEEASTEQLTAFLDEASSASSDATPVSASPLMGNGAATAAHPQKRKSVDVPLSATPEGAAGRKVKRKR
ncbi:hypothetical protein BV20DRAFT_850175 [Pilatotrama ljubarskyi]|nr:hypothetical protein BV20DRAFT_850175 [Pilatotrama ljubarskyi]